MTTYYVDPVNGNDANAGSSWALAKRTLTSVGPLPGAFWSLGAGDIVNVASTPDYTNPAVSFTNASTDVELLPWGNGTNQVLFDKYGNYEQGTSYIVANNYAGSSGGTFEVNATTKYFNFSRGASSVSTFVGYMKMGNIIAPSTAGFGGGLIGIRMNFGSGLNAPYITINHSEAAPRTFWTGQTSATISVDGTSTYTAPVFISSAVHGGPLFTSTGGGSTYIVWYDLSSFSGTINNIGFWATSAGTYSILNIYMVEAGHLIDKLTTGVNFLNPTTAPTSTETYHLIGASDTSAPMYTIGGWTIIDNSGAYRQPPTFIARMKFAYAGASYSGTGRTAKGAVLIAAKGTGDQVFDGTGAVKVYCGLDPITGAQTGFSRFIGPQWTTAPVTPAGSPGGSALSLQYYNIFSGASFYNWKAFSMANSTASTPGNYTFGDICSNGASTVKTSTANKSFTHYINLGPNTSSTGDSGSTALKQFSSSNTNSIQFSTKLSMGVAMLVSFFASPTFLLGHKRSGAFSAGGAGTSSFTGSRNRSFTFPSSASSVVTTFLKKATGVSYMQAAASGTSFIGSIARGMGFNPTAAGAMSIADPHYDKGFKMDMPLYSGNVWSFAPIIGMAWESISNSSVVQTIQRNRGYEFLSTNISSVTSSMAVARDAVFATTTASATSFGKLIRANFMVMNTVLVSSGVSAELKYNKAMKFIASTTSNVATTLLSTKLLGFVTHTSSVVASSIGRSRATTFAVAATGTVINNYSRLKAFTFNVLVNSAFSAKLLKKTKVAWASSSASYNVFANNLLMSFASTSTGTIVLDMLNRLRPVSLNAAEVTQSVFGVGINKTQNFATSTSSVVTLNGAFNRGMYFTVPMTSTMTANFSRLVGEQFAVTALPVISFFINRDYVPGFNVISVSGNTMVVELQRPLELAVGMLVDITGEMVVARREGAMVEGTATNSNAIGVNRGVQFHITDTTTAEMTMTRSITLTWGSNAQLLVNERANTNRLDEFYVDLDAPVSMSYDGTIVIGARRTTQGMLQDQHPHTNVTITPAPIFTVTVKEQD